MVEAIGQQGTDGEMPNVECRTGSDTAGAQLRRLHHQASRAWRKYLFNNGLQALPPWCNLAPWGVVAPRGSARFDSGLAEAVGRRWRECVGQGGMRTSGPRCQRGQVIGEHGVPPQVAPKSGVAPVAATDGRNIGWYSVFVKYRRATGRGGLNTQHRAVLGCAGGHATIGGQWVRRWAILGCGGTPVAGRVCHN
jgi:hypothetical protein